MTDHDHDLDDLSIPIALRRTRRTGTGTGTVRRISGVGSAAIKNLGAVTYIRERETSPPTPPTTPRTSRRTWKHKITNSTVTVRRGNKTHLHLSSGLAVNSLQLVEADELSLSTGLTPMVRRISLQPPSPAPAARGSSKCTYRTHSIAAVTPSRQRSAPAATSAILSSSSSCSSSSSSSSSPSTTKPSNTSNPSTIEVIQGHLSPQVLSLRLSQVHDGRSKPKRRSIQEKMNRVYSERRRREKEAQEAQEEIQRLRAELKEKNEAIERSHPQDDDTVDLDLDLDLELELSEVGNGKKVEAGSSGSSNGREVRGHVELREEVTEGKRREGDHVARQQPQDSPETPSNPTFHTALDDRVHDTGSGSGSETEALSLTTSQFSEAIRAQLDCSTPPPSGSRVQYSRPLPTTTTATATAIATATAVRAKPFPSPPTTSPMNMGMGIGMAMGMMPMTRPGAGAGTELPITPCSNSRHGRSASAMLSSRRTSNATTIQIHNLNNNEEQLEVMPTRSRTSYPPCGSASGPAPASTTTSASARHHNPNPNQQPHTLHHQEQLTTLTTLATQNQTLQTTLLRTQRSLCVALETIKKFQMESEQLRGEALLLQREKKELMEVITDVSGRVQDAVRKAVEKRDEMWKDKMRTLKEGIVEGVRGACEEVMEEGLDEEMSGVDEMRGYGSLQEERRGSSSRKRRREEEEEEKEEDDICQDEQGQERGDGERVDLGSGHSGDAGGGSGSYDDGLEDMERSIMRMRERMMRKRSWEEDTDPDA